MIAAIYAHVTPTKQAGWGISGPRFMSNPGR
jgi:hypothetical protein